MDIEIIKVEDLKEGQHFWNFQAESGDSSLERVIVDGVAIWADGDCGNCVTFKNGHNVYAKKL